ncbi:hypothetical protein CEUSTIGMA_g11359.t1 [Chlamydomonas eustigma]|uniref:Protein ENHANCED DISEASE RESISTANCE 2 C-terminal domain-containing protein n=1 Tax=Chlamydomonas eustigma TaxID=1157962 RepID=A0A250XLE9_9CHLO|nr:hypothetical protein CEUSTIGMA_g11359.t1 [Chlamydomonas eustigma]|eukprot:GAX83935.1 hypothetical protein CEUSTIGMA_g11359.t1 [Chlamydomonas eustigma]
MLCFGCFSDPSRGAMSTSNLAETYLSEETRTTEPCMHVNGANAVPGRSPAPSPPTKTNTLGPGVGPENLLLCLQPMMQAAVREQLPMAISRARRPQWMAGIEVVDYIRIGTESPSVKNCYAEDMNGQSASGEIRTVVEMSWKPSLDAILRVRPTTAYIKWNADNKKRPPPAMLDLRLAGIEVHGVLRLSISVAGGMRLRLLRQPGINVELTTEAPTPTEVDSSDCEEELLKLLKLWLRQAICSHVLESEIGPSDSYFPLSSSNSKGIIDPLDPLPIRRSSGNGASATMTGRSSTSRHSRYYSASDLPDVIPEVGVANESALLPLSSVTSGVLQDGVYGRDYHVQSQHHQQQELDVDRGRTMSNFNSENEIPEVKLDFQAVRKLATMKSHVWDGLHSPGKPCPYNIRGPKYLNNRVKIPAGMSAFTLSAFDMVSLPHAVQHVARYLPSVRKSGAPFGIVINLVIPGTPLLSLVATFVTDRDCFALANKKPPEDPMDGQHEGWTPFDFALHRFITGDNVTRNKMLKLIPHIDSGNWIVKNAVGTKPLIVGKALKTTYFDTKQYIEVDIDVSADPTASYITGMVRGATSGLVIDLGFVLEGQMPWELPEKLIGAARVSHLNVRDAVPLDISEEIPLLRPAFVTPV